jgi:hypothetical protein
MLMLFIVPVAADPALFHRIRSKDGVTLVLPNGECESKVVRRQLDQLTLELKKTTDACGKKKSIVRLRLSDVEDVVDNRRAKSHGVRESQRICTIVGLTLGGYAGVAIGEKTGSKAPILPLVVAGGVTGALLCRAQSAAYTVFANNVVPVQP